MTEGTTEMRCFEHYVEEIENGTVYLDAVLANTPVALLQRLKQNALVQDMQVRMLEADLARCFIARAVALLHEVPAPTGYSSPNDLALAIYTFVIGSAPTFLANSIVQVVADADRDDLRSARFVASEMMLSFDEKTGITNDYFPPGAKVPLGHEEWLGDLQEPYNETENTKAAPMRAAFVVCTAARALTGVWIAMPEVVIFAACEKAVVDRFTNELSLHTVMDQVQPLLARDGKDGLDTASARYYLAPFYTVTVWRCSEEEVGRKFEQHVKLITPDSRELELVAPLEFVLKQQRHRIVQGTPPITARLVGEYTLHLCCRAIDNDEDWQVKHEYSFILRGDASVHLPSSMLAGEPS